VNDEAVTLGVVDVELGGELAVDFVVVVFEDELPHAATPKSAVTVSAAKTALPFSKCTITNLPLLLM
jgi:hypothetical protein